mgnify:CR=1 FL=1
MAKIFLYGGSFNPPCEHHRAVVKEVLRTADAGDRVIIVPSGPRPDKPTNNDIDPIHRAAMCVLGFNGIDRRVRVHVFDLENDEFTRTHALDEMYAGLGEVWHVVGTDLLYGECRGVCTIRECWRNGRELWNTLKFVIAVREGSRADLHDLPLHHRIICPKNSGSSENVRRRIANHESIAGFLAPAVEAYIERHKLYREEPYSRFPLFGVTEPRIIIGVDIRNSTAMALAKRFSAYRTSDLCYANMIVSIGGDGTMLRSIREWSQLKIPFLGINAGHTGFLLNEFPEGGNPAGFLSQIFEVAWCPLLHVETIASSRSNPRVQAFNDAWMQVRSGSMGWFELKIDGIVRHPHLMGDAILVATAAGSTGYAYNMGIDPVELGSSTLTIAGSNMVRAHNWKGEHINGGSVVEISAKDASGWRRLYGFADGRELGEVISMKVRRSRTAAAELLFTSGWEVRRRRSLRSASV